MSAASGGYNIEPGQLRRAFLTVWLVVSTALLCLLVAPWLLPSGLLHDMALTCRSQLHHGRPCPLCGMTTAFVYISQGGFQQALAANKFSLLLYFLFVANEVTVLWFAGARAARLLSHWRITGPSLSEEGQHPTNTGG